MKKHSQWIWVLIGLFSLIGLMALLWRPTAQPIPITLAHYADSTGKMGINEALSTFNLHQFKPIQRTNFGLTSANHWLYFKVQNDYLPKNFSIEIANHRINQLAVFERKYGRLHSLGLTGDIYPFKQRPSPNRSFVYPIQLNANETAEYFVFLDKRHEELLTDIFLWQATHFEEKEQRTSMIWGIIGGIFLLFLIVNSFFWNFTKDPIFGWYIVYIGALLLRMLVDLGFAFQYLWPNFPAINQPDILFPVLWLLAFAMLSFVALFIGQTDQNSKAFRIVKWYRWVLLVVFAGYWGAFAAGLLANPGAYRVVYAIHWVLGNTAVILLAWGAIERFFSPNRDRLVVLFAITLVVQMLGYGVIAFQHFLISKGINPWIDSYVIALANFVLDIGIFSYGLSQRLKGSFIQNEQLELELLRTQQEQNQRIIAALKSEREQITQALYEDVGATIATADWYLSKVKHQVKDQERIASLPFVQKLLNKSLDDLHTVTLNLMPVEFAELGLAKSVEATTQNANRSGDVKFDYSMFGPEKRLAVATEVQLYRIVNELINNILKHAQASKASIGLRYQPDSLIILVQDNGKGFDLQKVEQGYGGIGVRNLYSRARYLNAEIKIDSSATGTSVEVKMPYA